MNQRDSYKEKVVLFKEYAGSHPNKNLLELYNEWAEKNNIYGVERHEIWRRVRHIRGKKTRMIKEGSEEWMRLQAVLEILFDADLAYLNTLLEQKKLS